MTDNNYNRKRIMLNNKNLPGLSSDFIATVVLASHVLTEEWGLTQEKDPALNEMRMAEAKEIIQKIIQNTGGDGVILFPAGWFHSGKKPADSCDSWLIENLCRILQGIERNIVVCIGVDGSFNPPDDKDPFDKDQIAIAINQNGIISKGRKFYPTVDEKPYIEKSSGYLENESNKSRIFELNGVKYYLFECNDIKAPFSEKKNYPNPGIDVGLNLIHRVYERRGQRKLNQENSFPCNFGARSSFIWNVPIFLTTIFFRKDLPREWPTGVFCFREKIPRSTYEEIGLSHTTLESIPLEEGYAIVHVFQDIVESIEKSKGKIPRGDFSSTTTKTLRVKRVATHKKSIGKYRSEFFNVVKSYREQFLDSNLLVKLNTKDQFRITYPEWPIVGKNPRKYIFYEFDDWISKGKHEISAEILFGLPYFKEVGDLVFEYIAGIPDFAPGAKIVFDKTTTSGWYRLKMVYPDSADPIIIGQSMSKLILETRDIVNNWISEK